MTRVDPDLTCRSCAFFEAGACRVYPHERVADPARTTCNEHRHPAGNDWGVAETPPPGLGVYDLHELGGELHARLRRPRRLRSETDGRFAGRLGGALRSKSRLGGYETVAQALAAGGPAGFRELRRTLLSGAADPAGRTTAFQALQAMDDPRVPEALRALVDDEDETVRAQAGLGLARLLDPAAPDPETLLYTGSLERTREIAERAQAYLASDWERIAALGDDPDAVRAARHRVRAQGALLGARLALHPESAELVAPLRLAFRAACQAAGGGGATPMGLAEHVFRRGSAALPPSDRAAALLVVPFAVSHRLPAATTLVTQAAAEAGADSLHVAAALSAVQLVRRAIAAEDRLDPVKVLSQTAKVLHDVHPGFFRVFRSGTRRIRRPPRPGRPGASQGRPGASQGRPPPPRRSPPLTTVAQALARGFEADVETLRDESLAAPLRACVGMVLGAVKGPGVFPRAWLDQLPPDELEDLRQAAAGAR